LTVPFIIFINYRVLSVFGLNVLPEAMSYNGQTQSSKAADLLKSLLTMIGLDQRFYPKCVIQKNYFRNKGDDHVIRYKDSDCCVEIKTCERQFNGARGEHVAMIMPMCSGKSFYSRKFDNVIDIDS